MPWWAWVLVLVASHALGALIGAAAALIYVGRGMWG